MPPKTSLLDLAIRRNTYVCRSCVAALGCAPQPAQQFARSFTASPARRKGGRPKPTWDWENLADDKLEELAKKPTERPFTVNFFEKDDKTGELRRIPKSEQEQDDAETFDEYEMEDEFAEIGAGFEKKVGLLQETYEKLSNKASVLEKILAKHGPPGAVEALNKALAGFDKDHSEGDGEDVQNETKIPNILCGQPGVDLSNLKVFKVNNQIYHLNQAIAKAMEAINANQLTSLLIARTWSYFGLLAPVLKPGVVIPTAVWQAFWKIFSWEGPINTSRMARIKGLAQVMDRMGVSMTDEQQLLAIEATFVDGDPTRALNTWKRMVSTFDNKGLITMAYWELGVRMWSEYGDLQRAERASKTLLNRASPATPADSRVLLHLIRLYCKSPKTADKGFELYRRMRDLAQRTDAPMNIEDYDDVISVFLSLGHTDYAMFAFTDMMFAGAVDLYGKTKLPSGVRNRFFFGKWLKRLIGAGDLDGAKSVLVFMQKNSVMAASVQVNGLIGAWLRSGTVQNRAQAEKLGLAMIESRRKFIELRQRNLQTEWPIRLTDDRVSTRNHKGDDLKYMMAPRATTETFVLMAENYRERGLFNQLEELFVAWKECEMPNDALIMNELMMAAVAQGRGDKARELYELMVHDNDIVPNADTFTVLFASLPVNQVRKPVLSNDDAIRSGALARSIYRDMISMTWVFQDSLWRTKKGLLSESQVKLILHSFRKAGDFAGVMAALEGLRDVIGFAITRNVLLEMIAEYEGIDRPSPRTTRVVVHTTMKLQSMIEIAQKRYASAGAAHGGIAPEAVKDPNFLYRIILDYYHTKIQEMAPEDRLAGRLLDHARDELGVKWTDKRMAQRRWTQLKSEGKMK